MALLVLTHTTLVTTAKAPVFVTKKAALTQEYMLLSTYVNPASEAYRLPEVVQSQDGRLDITRAYPPCTLHVASGSITLICVCICVLHAVLTRLRLYASYTFPPPPLQ